MMSFVFVPGKSLIQRKKAAQASCPKQKMEKRYADTRKPSGVLMVTMRRPCSILKRPLKPLQMTGVVRYLLHNPHFYVFTIEN